MPEYLEDSIREVKLRLTRKFENWVDEVDLITDATAEFVLRNALLEMLLESQQRELNRA